MENTVVKFTKLDKSATAPVYGTPFAAGADLRALLDEYIPIAPGETYFVHTGIAAEIPTGLVGLIYARSGLACKRGLAPANCVGVIDSDYRGEVMVGVINQFRESYTIQPGERIAQMVIMPVSMMPVREVTELDDTVRGAGGFGSTGKN